jgi:hypothetical protein
LQEYKKGIAEFTAMKDFAVLCTVQDPATAVPSGYNDKSSVALWGRGGKMKVKKLRHKFWDLYSTYPALLEEQSVVPR